MGLLDELIEKKDIRLYCSLRKRRFRESLAHIKDIKTPQSREYERRMLIGRIRELDHLVGKISNIKELKSECKSLWKHFDLKKREKIGKKKGD